MEAKKIVGIWIRVSTEDQAQGEAPEHHEERARWYCNSKGWEVATVYHLEAVSGKSVIDHPEAKRMLQDVKDGHITGLVFSKLARLARSTKELLTFADYFRDHSADLISLQESIDTSSPAGRLFYTIIAAMAQWEREEIGSRVAASVPVRARLGKPTGGAAPFGYRWEGEKKEKCLVLDEQEAPVRKLMYEIFLRTKRKKTTAAELNKLGYRTREGGQFTDTTVDRLLRDPAAKGIRRANYTKSRGNKKHWDVKPSSEWVLVQCPSIISEDTYNQCNQFLAQQYKKRRKPGRQSEFLLAGFVQCHCSNKMYVFHNTKIYYCKKCKNKISVEDIDDIYYAQLKNFLFTESEIGTYQEQTETLLQEKVRLLETSKADSLGLEQKMGQLVKMRMDQELTSNDFNRYYQPLKHRLEELEGHQFQLQGEIDALKIQVISSESVLSDAKDLYSRWQHLSYEERRAIVETITEQIIIEDRDVSIRLAYLPNHVTSQKDGTRQRNYMDS